MNKYSTVIILVAAIFISCSDKNSTFVNSSVKKLKGEIIETNDDFFGQKVKYADSSNIYLESYKTNYYQERFELIDSIWILTDKYGSKGQGPNDIMATETSFSANGNKMLLYDALSKKGLLYNVGLDTCIIEKLDALYQIPNDYRAEHIILVNDSTITCRVDYSSYGLPDDQSMVFFGSLNLKNGEFRLINGYSIDDNQQTPYTTKQLVYGSCYFVKRPSSNRYAICYDRGQVLEIFDIENYNINNRHILKQSYPVYVKSDDEMPKYKDTGVCDGLFMTATDDYIYVLPSRYTITDLQKIFFENAIIDKFEGHAKGYLFKDEVWVYDWDGNLVKEFALSPMVSMSIAITPDNKYIYGLSENENYMPILMRYETGL